MHFDLAIAVGCNLKMRVQNARSTLGQDIEKFIKDPDVQSRESLN